jgi:hypothetical protein
MKTCKRKYLKDQPKWKYKAIDEDGTTYYYTTKPVQRYNKWWPENLIAENFPSIFTKTGCTCQKVFSGKKDWKKSLRKLKD